MMRHLTILLLSCLWLSSHGQVGIITTIAGTGVTGYSGDNGPATDAKLSSPAALCLDKYGDLLICDAFNHVIRKVSASTGVISTIAGTGVGGYNGDNIIATNAQLFVPDGICTDENNNLYISDGLNQRIRKITATTGLITTIAGNGLTSYAGDGGPATNASMNVPVGICFYGNNLYFCDYNNGLLRKVNLATGVITRFAGTGSAGYIGDHGIATNAQFNGISDVFCNERGDIFVADQYNGAVRKIDVITNVITTVAGRGMLGYSGDGGPATNAKMNEAVGVFVDKFDNLLISDYRNGAIRKVDASIAAITTLAGGSAGYGGDGGVATNAKLMCVDVWADNGTVYIADYVNERIRKVTGALKVNNLNIGEMLLLYPNPTTGRFTVQTPGSGAIVTVNDAVGKVVYQTVAITSKLDVDISGMPTGIYFVCVQNQDEKYASKILLTK